MRGTINRPDHKTRTLISFWCKGDLNFNFLFKRQEASLVELKWISWGKMNSSGNQTKF